MTKEPVLRSLPEIGVEFPSDPLMGAAFAYAQKYCPGAVNNHVARCAYWALILAKKLPEYNKNDNKNNRPLNLDDVVLICLLHDLGLANWIFGSDDPDTAASNPLPGLLTLDKRFEVDGASIARAFVQAETVGTSDHKVVHKTHSSEPWDDVRLDRLWTAIVLHTTPSIARHAPTPEVVLSQMAIETDFFGPYWSPTFGLVPAARGESDSESEDQPQPQPPAPIITVDEYRAVTTLFPREDFEREGVKRTMCTLCRRKPATSYDNIVGLYGKEYGPGYGQAQGSGTGREEFARAWEARQSPEFLLQLLDRLSMIEDAK